MGLTGIVFPFYIVERIIFTDQMGTDEKPRVSAEKQDKEETMTQSPCLKLLNACRLSCCHLVSVREAARGRNRVMMQ